MSASLCFAAGAALMSQKLSYKTKKSFDDIARSVRPCLSKQHMAIYFRFIPALFSTRIMYIRKITVSQHNREMGSNRKEKQLWSSC